MARVNKRPGFRHPSLTASPFSSFPFAGYWFPRHYKRCQSTPRRLQHYTDNTTYHSRVQKPNQSASGHSQHSQISLRITQIVICFPRYGNRHSRSGSSLRSTYPADGHRDYHSSRCSRILFRRARDRSFARSSLQQERHVPRRASIPSQLGNTWHWQVPTETPERCKTTQTRSQLSTNPTI